MNVEKMVPGMEMDALISEKVFGLNVELIDNVPMWVGVDLPGSPYILKDGRFGHSILPYSTDIREAAKVFEKMGPLYNWLERDHHRVYGKWNLCLQTPDGVSHESGWCQSLEEAICKAALKVVGCER